MRSISRCGWPSQGISGSRGKCTATAETVVPVLVERFFEVTVPVNSCIGERKLRQITVTAATATGGTTDCPLMLAEQAALTILRQTEVYDKSSYSLNDWQSKREIARFRH